MKSKVDFIDFDEDNASLQGLDSDRSSDASRIAIFESDLEQIFSPSTCIQHQKTLAAQERSRE